MDWLMHVFDPANIGAFFTQFQADMQKPTFWLAVGKIIWINILLSGDNALVIAMACRGLHGRHRMWGVGYPARAPRFACAQPGQRHRRLGGAPAQGTVGRVRTGPVRAE